ncbi:MAG: hypothetical protein K2J80_12825, partial [Oscillospiraceae bacterium]|nr:hypothetical protein [Oscillospiraceae bacterium]
MKKAFQNIVRFINVLYKILPFFLGMYCYYPFFADSGERIYPFLDSVYASLRLYSGCTESGIAVGAVLQIARFLALAATLSILINVFNKLNDIINHSKLFNSNSTVIFGSSVYANYLYESLN